MPQFAHTRPDHAELSPAPVSADAVVSGDPRPRSTCVSRPKGDGLSVGTWECGAGSFRYAYMTDETVTVLSGSARVTDEHGQVTVMREGDWVTFTAGDVALWEVDDFIRKVWVTTAVNHLHSRILLRGRVLFRRATVRFGAWRVRAAAVGGSAVGVAGVVALLPV